MSLFNYNTYIFDFDGVIIDSNFIKKKLISIAAKDYIKGKKLDLFTKYFICLKKLLNLGPYGKSLLDPSIYDKLISLLFIIFLYCLNTVLVILDIVMLSTTGSGLPIILSGSFKLKQGINFPLERICNELIPNAFSLFN